jgi:hypothetical protein
MPKSIKGVMHEFKHGKLHSGSKKGPVVTKRKQAVAIALSEQKQKAPKKRFNAGAYEKAHKKVFSLG